jgi:hypothetical protein
MSWPGGIARARNPSRCVRRRVVGTRRPRAPLDLRGPLEPARRLNLVAQAPIRAGDLERALAGPPVPQLERALKRGDRLTKALGPVERGPICVPVLGHAVVRQEYAFEQLDRPRPVAGGERMVRLRGEVTQRRVARIWLRYHPGARHGAEERQHHDCSTGVHGLGRGRGQGHGHGL